MIWEEAVARRLARHFLLERAAPERLVEVAGALCGVHAQMMPAAELSIGVRVGGVTARDVGAALWEQRGLVKTYGIRGTLHLFPAHELPLWMAAARRRNELEDPRRLADLGLDEAQVAALVAAIAEALHGRRLTLRQLGEAVVRLAGPWANEATGSAWSGGWPKWRYALGWAAAAGHLCFGPNEGSQVTFVHPETWLGISAAEVQAADPQAALAEVFRRYLRAYGPATARDFAQWFALPPRVARELATSLGKELQEVDVEGYRALLPASDVDATAPSPRGAVHLLPHFDCYLRGFHPRERLVGAWAGQAGGGTGTVPVLLLEGAVAGVWERRWERRPQGRRLAVRVNPFEPLPAAARRRLELEATRIGEFLETRVSFSTGSVTVRPHL
jgi:hypothetical protein